MLKNFLFLLQFIKPHKKTFIIVFLIMLLYNLLNVSLPYLTYSVIIDRLLPENDFKMIGVVVSCIILLLLFLSLLEFIQGYMMSYLGTMVGFGIRNKLFRHLETLSLKFYSTRNSGEILERLNRDVASVQGVLTNEIISLAISCLRIVFLTFTIFAINWILAIPMVILVTIQFLLISVVLRKLHKGIHFIRERQSKLTGYLQERISMVKLVQIFVRQKSEEQRHIQDSRIIIDQNLMMASTRSKLRTIMFFLRYAAPLFILWIAGFMVIEKVLMVGTMLAMWTYSRSYFDPVWMIVMNITRLQESLVGIQRLNEYFKEEPEVTEDANPIKKSRVKGEIEFKNVNFSYENNNQILHNISLKINAGETVAFVGESGSGKSTVTNLIFRFYDPDNGEILLDGEPLKKYSLRHLRKNIGVVFQETELFVTSLRENLSYGASLKITDKQINDAVDQSLLNDVVAKLPNGLDTIIEERGANFSGGEKQRMAICRVILKNPNIIIFDEATSALDSNSEKEIQETMKRVMKIPTAIIIAHRLSTVVDADRIFVFKKGRIAEEGKHQELLAKQGEYYKLWSEQVKED